MTHGKNKYLLQAILTLSMFCNIAIAENISDLYSAEIKVTDKSAESWGVAVKKGLLEVIVKVSGNTGAVTLPLIQEEVEDSGKYVQYYNYTDYSHNDDAGLNLHMGFDNELVDKLLADSSQAIWGNDRAQTLVWFFNDNTSKGNFLTQEGPESNIFTDSAKYRGVKIMFPISDLKYVDTLQEKTADKDLTKDLVDYSAANYAPNQVLIGKQISQEQNAIFWRLIVNDAEFSWKSYGDTLKDSIESAVNHLVDDMVSGGAVLQAQDMKGSIKVAIDNVESLADYAAIVAKLQHDSVIDSFNVAFIKNNRLGLSIVAKGGSLALAKSLDNYNDLQLEVDVAAYDDVEMLYALKHSK
jgi:hypothetical protein